MSMGSTVADMMPQRFDQGLDLAQLRDLVIRPTLLYLGLHTAAAETLLLGTAMQESGGRYLKQLGRGPALGIYQMEPVTHDDHWRTFLPRHPELLEKVDGLLGAWPSKVGQLATNLAYATAMARVHYYRRKEPLPDGLNSAAMAAYYKKYYNTPAGAATEDQFAGVYRRALEV